MNRPWTARGIGFTAAHPNGPTQRGREPDGRSANSCVDLLIDLTVGTSHSLVIRFPRSGLLQERCARLLPALAEAHDRVRPVAYAPSPGGLRGDADARDWRVVHVTPEVRVEPGMAADAPVEGLSAEGAEALRVELPASGFGADFGSTWRIDLAMLTLDQIVGLAYGTLLANHSAHPLTLDPTLVLGESCAEYAILSLDSESGVVRESPQRREGIAAIQLQPGQALRTMC